MAKQVSMGIPGGVLCSYHLWRQGDGRFQEITVGAMGQVECRGAPLLA